LAREDKYLMGGRLVSGSEFIKCVFVADRGHGANLPHAPQYVGSNIGTLRLVAQIFGEKFFAPVRRCEARLDRYLRHIGSP
jgi:hypothetical protein